VSERLRIGVVRCGLVHEPNALRGVVGEPTEVVSADLSPRVVSVNLRFGEPARDQLRNREYLRARGL
jgi:hypothetical protein